MKQKIKRRWESVITDYTPARRKVKWLAQWHNRGNYPRQDSNLSITRAEPTELPPHGPVTWYLMACQSISVSSTTSRVNMETLTIILVGILLYHLCFVKKKTFLLVASLVGVGLSVGSLSIKMSHARIRHAPFLAIYARARAQWVTWHRLQPRRSYVGPHLTRRPPWTNLCQVYVIMCKPPEKSITV